MEPIKWYIYNEENIPNILTENSAYYCTDTEEMYFDYGGMRNKIHPVPKYLFNDIDRFKVIIPENNRMYFTLNTGRIWLYINGWILLTAGISVFFEYPLVTFKRIREGSKTYSVNLVDLNKPSFFDLKVHSLINVYSPDLSDTGINKFLETHTFVDANDLVGTEITSKSVTFAGNIVTAYISTTDLLTTDEIYGRVLFCSDEFDSVVVEDISEGE